MLVGALTSSLDFAFHQGSVYSGMWAPTDLGRNALRVEVGQSPSPPLGLGVPRRGGFKGQRMNGAPVICNVELGCDKDYSGVGFPPGSVIHRWGRFYLS